VAYFGIFNEAKKEVAKKRQLLKGMEELCQKELEMHDSIHEEYEKKKEQIE